MSSQTLLEPTVGFGVVVVVVVVAVVVAVVVVGCVVVDAVVVDASVATPIKTNNSPVFDNF